MLNLVKDGQRRRYRRRRWCLSPERRRSRFHRKWTRPGRSSSPPVAQRAVVVLHYYEDLPLVDMAACSSGPNRRSAPTIVVLSTSSERHCNDQDPAPTLRLDQHLRHVLQTVASTVTPEQWRAGNDGNSGLDSPARGEFGLFIGRSFRPGRRGCRCIPQVGAGVRGPDPARVDHRCRRGGRQPLPAHRVRSNRGVR